VILALKCLRFHGKSRKIIRIDFFLSFAISEGVSLLNITEIIKRHSSGNMFHLVGDILLKLRPCLIFM
jgi:hypothetical protein